MENPIYVGQTKRTIHKRLNEHYFGNKETQISLFAEYGFDLAKDFWIDAYLVLDQALLSEFELKTIRHLVPLFNRVRDGGCGLTSFEVFRELLGCDFPQTP